MVTAAVIGAVGAVGGAAIASSGAKSAANTQANAANRATDVGEREFNTITQQEQPFMRSGYGALSQLNYLLGIPEPQQQGQTIDMAPDASGAWTMAPDGTMMPRLTNGPSDLTGFGANGLGGGPMWTAGQGMPNAGVNGVPAATGAPAATGSPAGGFGSLVKPFTLSDFYNYSPAYQFQKQQGTQGVLNGSASGMGALSGAAAKDLISFNQNLANTSFNNAFNQYQTQQGNIFNRLSGIAQLGQTAAANTGQQGTALTGQIGQSITNAGSAAAAGQVGSANAWSGAISSAAPWLAGAAARGGSGFTPSNYGSLSDSAINYDVGYPAAIGG